MKNIFLALLLVGVVFTSGQQQRLLAAETVSGAVKQTSEIGAMASGA